MLQNAEGKKIKKQRQWSPSLKEITNRS
jgi:hypothetical protein